MLRKKEIYFALIVIAMVSLACAMPFGDSDSSSGTNADPNLLFEDDFSKTSSGWDQYGDEYGTTDYGDGYYQIYVNDTSVDYWANPGKNFTDLVVSVDAEKVGGPDDNDFGLICRYVDESNFYFFLASSDGYYAIGRMIDGSQELIGQEQLNYTDAINLGNSTNALEASCVGTSLSFKINGETVASVEDATFSEGDIGLIAGTYDTVGTDVHFDNIKVMKP